MTAGRPGRLLLAALLALLIATPLLRAEEGPATAAEEEAEEGTEEGEAPQFSGKPYSVSFAGPASEELIDYLKAVSKLVQDQETPPFSRAGLAQRVREDKQTLVKALNSRGYYQPTLDFTIGDGEPTPVLVTVDPGPQTRLAEFAIDFTSDRDLDKLKQPSLEELGITLGAPAISQQVLDAEGKLIAYLGNNGFPDATIVGRKATVDLDRNEMQVALRVDQGAFLLFGPLAIDGLDRTDEEYIRRILQWPEGETFSNRRLEKVRREAVSTNLFSQVQITRDLDDIDEDDEQRVKITFEERPPRTVSLGAGFATDFSNTPFGFIGEASWEHRNILGRGELLRLSANAQPDEQAGAVLFSKPNWFRNDQSLQWRFTIANEAQPAYKEFSVETSLGVERELSPHWTVFGGGGIKYLISDDLDSDSEASKQDYVLYTIPTRVTFDNRDNRLDATEGFLGILGLTPTLVTVSETAAYLQASLSGNHYYQVLTEPNIVLAGRARVASLVGTSIDNIPAGERLYAGGGGSVRGYEVDSLGPLDSDNDAIGGRSLLEFGVEARWRFWEDYGVVPFLDAGQVYEDSYPDFSETIQYAAGLGFRYYSPIGPIRLDFAHPLNKRQRDRELQFYISIGQAF